MNNIPVVMSARRCQSSAVEGRSRPKEVLPLQIVLFESKSQQRKLITYANRVKYTHFARANLGKFALFAKIEHFYHIFQVMLKNSAHIAQLGVYSCKDVKFGFIESMHNKNLTAQLAYFALIRTNSRIESIIQAYSNKVKPKGAKQ